MTGLFGGRLDELLERNNSGLIEELQRSRVVGIRPDLTEPEGTREFGSQVVRDVFEEYVKPGEPVIQRTQGD